MDQNGKETTPWWARGLRESEKRDYLCPDYRSVYYLKSLKRHVGHPLTLIYSTAQYSRVQYSTVYHSTWRAGRKHRVDDIHDIHDFMISL